MTTRKSYSYVQNLAFFAEKVTELDKFTLICTVDIAIVEPVPFVVTKINRYWINRYQFCINDVLFVEPFQIGFLCYPIKKFTDF